MGYVWLYTIRDAPTILNPHVLQRLLNVVNHYPGPLNHRLLANVAISPSAGPTLAASSAVSEPLLDMLGAKRISDSEELVGDPTKPGHCWGSQNRCFGSYRKRWKSHHLLVVEWDDTYLGALVCS